MSKIAVLGAGAWGTAIALSLTRTGEHEILLWSHSEEEAAKIAAAHENLLFLPGFPLPESITVTADMTRLTDAELLVSVIPSEFLRPTIKRVAPFLHDGQILVSATKGVEDATFLRMSEVIVEVLSAAGKNLQVGALSGPSFALEVAQGQPTAVTVAFENSETAARIQQDFSSESWRIYTSTDLIGIELGGALKNVIAIAAGVAAGLGLGYNTAAALITRGIAEITRLAEACGGRKETLGGLSGVGDLVLTCTGSLSRNRTVGEALGKGRKLPEILDGLGGKVAEGVRTCRAALGLARKHGVEMPIAEQMEQILDSGKEPREAIRELMLRPGRDE